MAAVLVRSDVAGLLLAARDTIDHYGHRADCFGDTWAGFSIEGALYQAARLLADRDSLVDPFSTDETRRFVLCQQALAVLADVLRSDAPPLSAVAEANTDKDRALSLLDEAVDACHQPMMAVAA